MIFKVNRNSNCETISFIRTNRFFGRRPSDFTLTYDKINSNGINIGRIFIGHFDNNSLFDCYFTRTSVIGKGLFDCAMAKSVGKRYVRINIKTQ
jgi:hypothetical protein